MKVLFDAYWWESGPPSGRMVVRELIRAWRSAFPEDELTAATRYSGCVKLDLPENVVMQRLRLRPHALSAMTELGVIARLGNYDAVISQNFTTLGAKTATTFLHDVLFQSNPEFFSLKEKAYLSLIPASLKLSKLIYTSSFTEAQRIQEHNSTHANVVPVGLAVGSDLTNALSQRPETTIQAQTFVLAVGRLNHRKNLATILEACCKANNITPQAPLYIVGSPDGLSGNLSEAARSLIDDKSVVYLGNVSEGNLRWLYENAQALIFLSLDEGFGLPPLEALSFGCPVVLSDIPVLREIYEGYAEFVHPTDQYATAVLIDKYISAPRELRVYPEGLSRYSWLSTVQHMRKSVNEVIQNNAK